MRQTRTDRYEMFCAADDYLANLVCLDCRAGAWLLQLVEPDILSGVGADLLLRSLTFNKLYLEWDENDELRLLESGFADNVHKYTKTHLSEMIEGIGKLWETRLAERHVAFDFTFPIKDYAAFYNDVTSLGFYIGVDSDIDALLGNVPVDDILA